MELEFELKNKQEVRVIATDNGIRKEVGYIFTPSGSGHDIRNAIQVCGFTDAFDLWGCAIFAKNGDKEKVVARLSNRNSFIQVKDIQLKFDWDTELHHSKVKLGDECMGCYNNPCTCDNKKLVLNADEIIEGKGRNTNNPYNVKRAEDLNLEKVKKDEKDSN